MLQVTMVGHDLLGDEVVDGGAHHLLLVGPLEHRDLRGSAGFSQCKCKEP
jgi:hypothetical protein